MIDRLTLMRAAFESFLEQTLGTIMRASPLYADGKTDYQFLSRDLSTGR